MLITGFVEVIRQGGDTDEVLRGQLVSGNYFQALGALQSKAEGSSQKGIETARPTRPGRLCFARTSSAS